MKFKSVDEIFKFYDRIKSRSLKEIFEFYETTSIDKALKSAAMDADVEDIALRESYRNDARTLLKLGANPNILSHCFDFEIGNMLIAHGADPTENSSGKSFIKFAILQKKIAPDLFNINIEPLSPEFCEKLIRHIEQLIKLNNFGQEKVADLWRFEERVFNKLYPGLLKALDLMMIPENLELITGANRSTSSLIKGLEIKQLLDNIGVLFKNGLLNTRGGIKAQWDAGLYKNAAICYGEQQKIPKDEDYEHLYSIVSGAHDAFMSCNGHFEKMKKNWDERCVSFKVLRITYSRDWKNLTVAANKTKKGEPEPYVDLLELPKKIKY